MYCVHGQTGQARQFERMDKAAEFARGVTAQEDTLFVENSKGEAICRVPETVATWAAQEFLDEYKRLKTAQDRG